MRRDGAELEPARAMVARLAVVVAGLVVYYTVDWTLLQVLLRNTVVQATRLCAIDAHEAVYNGAPAIRVGDDLHWYAVDCTYASLVLLLAPLIWKRKGTLRPNFSRVLGMAAAVLALNAGRCWTAVCLQSVGVSGSWAHGVIHYATYWPILLFAVVQAVGHDYKLGGPSGERR